VQTVRDIKSNKEKVLEFTKNCSSVAGPSKHKAMKKSTYENLDAALLQWFQQKRSEEAKKHYGLLCSTK